MTEAILIVLTLIALAILGRVAWIIWQDRREDAEAWAQMQRRYEAQRDWERRIVREAEVAACKRMQSRGAAPAPAPAQSRQAESRTSSDTPQHHLYSPASGSDSRSCDSGSDSSSCDSGSGGGD